MGQATWLGDPRIRRSRSNGYAFTFTFLPQFFFVKIFLYFFASFLLAFFLPTFAVMVAVPFMCAVTTPLPSTVATDALLELHSIVLTALAGWSEA